MSFVTNKFNWRDLKNKQKKQPSENTGSRPLLPLPTLHFISRELNLTPCLKSNPQCSTSPRPSGPCRPQDSESEPGELGALVPGARRAGRRPHGRRGGDAAAAGRGARFAGFAQEKAPRGPRPPLPRPGLPARALFGAHGAPGAARRRERRRGAAAGPAGGSLGDRGGGGQGACALQGRQIWREGECPKLFV